MKKKLNLNIQLFADEGVESVEDSGSEIVESVQEQKPASLIELLNNDPKLQSQFDSLLAKSNNTAIENAKAQWQEAQSEAEKLAKMDADQKLKYEMNKLRTQNEQLTGQINASNLYKQANVIARDMNIPASYLDLIDFTKETAESVSAKLNKIAETRTKDLESYMASKFRQKTPQERQVVKIDPYIEGFKSEF